MESPSEPQKSSWFLFSDYTDQGFHGRGLTAGAPLAGVHSVSTPFKWRSSPLLVRYPIVLPIPQAPSSSVREKEAMSNLVLKPCTSIRGWSFLKTVIWFPSSLYTQHCAYHRVHTQMFDGGNELGIFKYTMAIYSVRTAFIQTADELRLKRFFQ